MTSGRSTSSGCVGNWASSRRPLTLTLTLTLPLTLTLILPLTPNPNPNPNPNPKPSQEPTLFVGTVAENIQMGLPGATHSPSEGLTLTLRG